MSIKIPPSDHVFLETIIDCKDDLEEIQYLANDALYKIQTFQSDIQKAKKYLYESTILRIEHEANALSQFYTNLLQVMDEQSLNLQKISSDIFLDSIISSITESRELLRTHQTRLGALITSSDWQSPSIAHSIKSQAGRQEGSIYATINDYKRDQHWDAGNYERAFKKSLIHGLFTLPIQACITSSGMAAFSTILTYLILEKKINGPVLIGKSIYFENKALLQRSVQKNCIEIDEHDTDSILQNIELNKPSVIVLDSLANMPTIAVPDLKKIINYIVTNVKKETILIIDNTCLSVMLQPFPLVFGKFSKLSLIVFESLNKYHQYGMDRVTGGIFWTYGGDTGKLFDYRVHTGTNAPDILVASLPTPNKKILVKRLLRLGRNAHILSEKLSTWMYENPGSPFVKIHYPGLPDHPSYNWTREDVFHGSFFTIEFTKKYQTVKSYKRFIELVLHSAKKQRVSIVSGTSFGLNTTRIYLTAVRSTPNTPFIRVALGTESRKEIESITKIFLYVLKKF